MAARHRWPRRFDFETAAGSDRYEGMQGKYLCIVS